MCIRFNERSRVIQLILLFIPLINWIVEISVRWAIFFKCKDVSHFIFALLVTIFGIIPIFGWIDIIWCLLFRHMFYAVA